MSLKIVAFSAQVFLIKTILGQCIGNIGNSYDMGIFEGVLGKCYQPSSPCGWADFELHRPQLTIADCDVVSASYGGILNIQTLSPITPGIISLHSENQIQGPLSVYGTLPFLSAVALEGSLPTYGSGVATYQCGDGRVGILEENIFASGYDGIAAGNAYSSFGTSIGLGRPCFNGINNYVESVPNVYCQGAGRGFNCNKVVKCGCGF